MVANVSGNKSVLEFGTAQLAKVEYISDYGANIAAADVVIEGEKKFPVLITGIPAAIANSLMATKLAADAGQYVTVKVTVVGQPTKAKADQFYTVSYGGRLVVEA
jgi:hypothetical protein